MQTVTSLSPPAGLPGSAGVDSCRFKMGAGLGVSGHEEQILLENWR